MSEDKPKRFPIPHPGVLLAVGLLLSVIVGGLCVWIPYQREQVVIREIERLGGVVGIEQRGPEWLRDFVGDKWMVGFDSVWHVEFHEEPISDNDLKQLSGLANLKHLYLKGTRVTNEGVQSLKQQLADCYIEWHRE